MPTCSYVVEYAKMQKIIFQKKQLRKMDFLKDLNSLKNLAFCLQNRIFDLAVEDTFVRQ